jgi:hypothetical protein
MANFFEQIPRSRFIKGGLTGSLAVFYLFLQVTALYCSCVGSASHHHSSGYRAAQENSEDHQHAHDHTHSHADHSEGNDSSSHFPCYCKGEERLTLASTESQLIPSFFGKVMPAFTVHQIAFLTLPNLQFIILSNRSPPLASVPLHLKNQAFLI